MVYPAPKTTTSVSASPFHGGSKVTSDDLLTTTTTTKTNHNQEPSPELPEKMISLATMLQSTDEARMSRQNSMVTNEAVATSQTSNESDDRRKEQKHRDMISHLNPVSKVIQKLLTFHRNTKKHVDSAPSPQLVQRLTPVGKAMYTVLQERHGRHQQQSWNLTESKMVGNVWNTPRDVLGPRKIQPTEMLGLPYQPASCASQLHDEWLPKQMGELISRTTYWCDILSLSPPDGQFLKEFQHALLQLSLKKTKQPIIVRILFGNIVGSPIDCNTFIRQLTRVLPTNAGGAVHLWVGSWRKGVSWNHSKIVAVDGTFLCTGGHK